jgi:hypothetical protein
MQAYKTETTVAPDGTVTVNSLPFRAGERVEVIVLPLARPAASDTKYPLQGTTYKYEDPTQPVAEEHWEAVG